MKYKLMSQTKDDERRENLIGTFANQGMAMWAATLFTAHKVFGRDNLYWIQKGKKSFVPCTVIDPDSFNLYIPEK